MKHHTRRFSMKARPQFFLRTINTNEDIRPKLSNYPFNGNNLDMIYAFVDNDGNRFYFPSLSAVFISDGKIWYVTNNRSSKNMTDIHIETYEEALKIVQKLR